MDRINIVIADDHSGFRQALKQIIEADRDLTVVAAVADGAEALDAIVRFSPDVAVLDVRMPGARDGIDVARALMDLELSARTVIMTMHWDSSVFERAAAVGTSGYLAKETAVLDVVDAIRAAVRGETYVASALVPSLPLP